ncbi:hypothetical protein [Nocardia sp. bgisy118]|uniref:hypothetical protein n=1 Tax=Nocardia sp. bgisy118 TaxID=3413786 RepID=UPI003F4A4154
MVRFAAQLAASGLSDDRLFCTRSSVIVLDGASSHTGEQVITGGDYAEALGRALVSRIDGAEPLTSILRCAIAEVADQLALQSLDVPPSSTVALVRTPASASGDSDVLELLVLGDSVVIVGSDDGRQQMYTDERLSDLRLPAAEVYRDRMRQGYGFDEKHREILAELQRDEHKHRNVPGGFWIASENPDAADEALAVSVDLAQVVWVVVATDGVSDVLYAANESWESLSATDADGLDAVLAQLHQWEAETDPTGVARPRSKRHDDKTVAVIRFR